MAKNDKSLWLKFSAIGLSGLVLGGIGGAFLFPTTEFKVNPVSSQLLQKNSELTSENAELSMTLEELQAAYEELEAQEPEVVVEEKIVHVDNENLNTVLGFVYDAEDVTFITKDLFDDELDLIVDRIILVEDVKTQSKDYVLSNFAREIERYDNDYDRRDISRVKIDHDSVKFNSSSADFKYEDFEVTMEVEFRFDGSTESKEVKVVYYDGRVRYLEFI